MRNDDERGVLKEFDKLVNMSGKRLDSWLDTEESKEVGSKDDDKGESVGHKSGRKIVKLLEKKSDDLTAADLKHVHKVVGYIKRHLAQRPDGDITDTRWRHSLMNWGHDPKK